jgi:hypothetical protein
MRVLAVVGLFACGDSVSSRSDAALEAFDAAVVDASVDARLETVVVEMITDEHRAVPGMMFGGWGPHLGHLVRAPRAGGGEATYWVDDLCSRNLAGDCDVNVNRRVGVFRRDATGWTRLETIALTGVQQNTATIAVGGRLWIYGIASAAQRVAECFYEISTDTSGCTTLSIATGSGANYVGAAPGPGGARVVWWTNVIDGGGGSFSYIVDYGGGWNGPRTGGIGGYNDCAYAHAGFGPAGSAVSFFCQTAAGLAPNWTFATLVGSTAGTLGSPVTWTNALSPPPSDAIASTNDLYVDPVTGDAHLIARSTAGAAVYYYRPPGGSFGAPVFTLPSTFRARWIAGEQRVALVHDAGAGTIAIRTASPSAGAWNPAAWSVRTIALPAGFGAIYGIYPASTAYQAAPVRDVELAVVGAGDERTALYVTLD